MNAIKKVTAIKNTISELGADFISLVTESDVLIKNTKNKSVWQIPFTESDEGFTFDGTKAIRLQVGKEPVDSLKIHTNKLRKSINNIFVNENYDEMIVKLKSTIRTLPYVEAAEAGEKCTVPMGDGKVKCTGTIIAGKCSNVNCTSNEKNKPVIEKNELNAVTDGVKKMEEMFVDFSKATYLFDESGEINLNVAITPFTMGQRLDLVAESDNFLRKIGQYKIIKSKIESVLEAPITKEIFKSLVWTENFDTALAKALTVAKTKHTSLNILEARKLFISTIESVYSEEADMSKAAPWVYNLTTPNTDDKNKAPFLKFRTGAFTYESLKIISEELDKAFASKDLIPEDLDVLGNYRMIVEYMLQSKQINDHVLTTMIEEFNKRFVKTEEAYKDSPLGWRSRDEQLQGWIKGFARSIDTNISKVEA